MKFCTTCGAQMQDGQLFCSKCGAKSLDTGTASQPQHSSGYEDYKTVPIYEDNPQTPPSSGYVNPPVYQLPTPVPPQGKKKLSKGAIIGIVIGAVVLVLVIVGIILGVALSSSDSAQDFDNSYSQGDYSGNDSSDDSQSDDTDTAENFDFSAGEISGNTYTNSSLGITFTASPDGLDSDKPTLDLDESMTSKYLYDNFKDQLDEDAIYDDSRGMFYFQKDSMQYWLDVDLSMSVSDYDRDSSAYVYVVKYNDEFNDIVEYNNKFSADMCQMDTSASNPDAGEVEIGGNKYSYAFYKFDEFSTRLIASTEKNGYYISIVIDAAADNAGYFTEQECAKDILACFS